MEGVEFYLEVFVRGSTRVEGDSGFPGCIDISDWSWGLDLPDDTDNMRWAMGQGTGATHRSVARELTLKKKVDRASTALMAGAVNHTLYEQVVLTVLQLKDEIIEVVFKMDKCRITKYELTVSDYGNQLEESLTLDFQKLSMDYYRETLNRHKAGTQRQTSAAKVHGGNFTISTTERVDS